MPPKFDPTQVVDVFVRVTDGEVGAASSLAPKIGPLGSLSPKKLVKTSRKKQPRTGRAYVSPSNSLSRTFKPKSLLFPPTPRCDEPRSMATDLRGTVKEILGTCVFVGCTVDGKDPKYLQQEISEGEIDVPLE
ncbi:hypothetical protein CRYUN_Cryun05aG0239700 [Craigia yunnanensis]